MLLPVLMINDNQRVLTRQRDYIHRDYKLYLL